MADNRETCFRFFAPKAMGAKFHDTQASLSTIEAKLKDTTHWRTSTIFTSIVFITTPWHEKWLSISKKKKKIIKMKFTNVTARKFVTGRKGNWHRTNHVKRWELFRWAEINGDSGRLVLILAMIWRFQLFWVNSFAAGDFELRTGNAFLINRTYRREARSSYPAEWHRFL